MKNNQTNSKGFTIVELLVAMAVFTVVLLGAMAGFTQLGRNYYKGVNSAKTRDNNRSIVDELTQTIQFTKQSVIPPASVLGPEIALNTTDTDFFCIGPKRYTYKIDRKLVKNPQSNTKESKHVLWADEPNSGCATSTTAAAADMSLDDPCSTGTCQNGKELVSDNIRISKLSISTTDPNKEIWDIQVSLSFGNDGIDGALTTIANRRECIGNSIDVSFCAISEISTIAYRRVK